MNGQSDMICNERHTDDDTLLLILTLYQHFTALISTSCKFPSLRKRRRLFTYKKSHDEDLLHEWTHTISTVHNI